MRTIKSPLLFSCQLLIIFLLCWSCTSSSTSENIEEIATKKEPFDLLGHWESSVADDGEVSAERLEFANELMGGMMKYHFQEGNKITGNVAGYEMEGTYSRPKNGNKVILIFDDDKNNELVLEIVGSTLKLTLEEVVIDFNKVSKKNSSSHPLNKAVMDRFNTSKTDQIYGIWELKKITTQRGRTLGTLQSLEKGILLVFHKDDTYTKHLTPDRQIEGVFSKTGKDLTLMSEFGRTEDFLIDKLSLEVLTIKEKNADVVRYYLPIAAKLD